LLRRIDSGGDVENGGIDLESDVERPPTLMKFNFKNSFRKWSILKGTRPQLTD
jgi:hypothetical protein